VWADNDLSYLLSPFQERALKFIRAASGRFRTFRCSRRIGKTWTAVIDGWEFAGRTPGAIMRFAAPTSVDAEEIVQPFMEAVREEAPTAYKAHWRGDKQTWYWPNGSRMKLSGCDTREKQDRLRGRTCHRAWVDEAGIIPDLGYLMRSVLGPQFMTTGGDIIILSSPSPTPDHESTQYFIDAEAEGRGFFATIYDAIGPGSHVTEAMVVREMRETVRGLTDEEAWEHVRARTSPDDAAWQREYMAQFVTDPERAVLPEFSKWESTIVVPALDRPKWCDKYVSLDCGFHDLSVCGLGYLDFARAVLCVEEEVVARRTRSTELDAAIAQKEHDTWGEPPPPLLGPTLRRVVDAPLLVHAEMSREGREWTLARKDDLDAAINGLRLLIPLKLRIHQRCKTIVSHARNGIWNKQRTEFQRVTGEHAHHFDGLASLVYMARHVDWQHNPYPAEALGLDPGEHWIPPAARRNKDAENLAEIFRPRRR
jgi:hypothetical protein